LKRTTGRIQAGFLRTDFAAPARDGLSFKSSWLVGKVVARSATDGCLARAKIAETGRRICSSWPAWETRAPAVTTLRRFPVILDHFMIQYDRKAP
jgi:hypothetical protein